VVVMSGTMRGMVELPASPLQDCNGWFGDFGEVEIPRRPAVAVLAELPARPACGAHGGARQHVTGKRVGLTRRPV
jgi:hypothetical protein